MHELFIQLGSNMGNRSDVLQKAQQAMQQIFGEPAKVSGIYESQAWGKTDQQHFLNQIVSFKTTWSPEKILQQLKEIEREIGRTKTEKWGPRVIDLDILFYGNLVFNSSSLQIPHPHIQTRAFVLIPLIEIAPSIFHPLIKQTILQIHAACKDPLWVKLANIAP